MTKALIIADVHIDDYREHNLENDAKFRLNQFIKLAYRTKEVIENEKCEYLFICGDFLNKSSPHPYISNVAKQFLKIVSKVAKVYLVAGQHDLDTRSNLSSTTVCKHENTYLTLFEEIDNVHYLHKDILRIGDVEIGFNGWENNYDLSWINDRSYKKQVDILISHKTINGSLLSSGYSVKGNDISLDYFNVGFFGDIHKYQVLNNGKVVIPGAIIQHSLGDCEDNAYIVCNIETQQWYRIPTVSEKYKFLVFKKDSESNYEELIVSKSKDKITRKHIYNKLNILDLIQAYIDKQCDLLVA